MMGRFTAIKPIDLPYVRCGTCRTHLPDNVAKARHLAHVHGAHVRTIEVNGRPVYEYTVA